MAGRNKRTAVIAHPHVGEAPVLPTTALVASAVSYPGSVRRIYRGRTDWQSAAWAFYDTVPELRFGANWLGSALSRCILNPAEIKDNIAVPTDNAAIRGALDELFSGEAGQAQMLGSLGIHLTVAGEAYIVGRKVTTPDARGNIPEGLVWEVIGVNELVVANGAWLIDYQVENMARILLTDEDTVIRIWRPHPARRIEADSPIRTLLGTLSEIESLTQHIFNQTISRLAGAGVWVVPDGVEFPGSDKITNKAEGLVNLVGKSMLAAQNDPSSPASLIPIVVTAPKDQCDAFKAPIHFWSPFDEKVLEARRAAVLRFCVGMDMPPEVILGMTHGASSSGGTGTGSSHWTSWQIEESAIKLHVEPLLAIIGNCLVMQYLRPVTDNPAAAVLYDTIQLKLQPDRSKEAMELHDRGKLSDAALLRELGLDASDAANPEEFKRWLFARIAGASATPEQVAAAVKFLTGQAIPDGGDQPLPPGTNQPPAPSLLEHPSGRGIPDGTALLMAAESQVLRALERAGNRLKNKGLKPPVECATHNLHLYAGAINGDAPDLIGDAWSMVPIVFAGYDTKKIQAVLETYTCSLLTGKQAHSRMALWKHLESM